MTLADCDPGDWLAVRDGADGWRVLEFGARLSAVGKKKDRHYTSALVTPLDRDTFDREPRSATMVSIDLEVVEVIATAAWRRASLPRVRGASYTAAHTENGDDDPMHARRGGTF